MGNLATNGQLINANHATVNGNAMTNNGTVGDGDNVTGQQSGNFYQELTPFTAGMLNPAWSGVQDGGTVTANATYTASTDATNPTLVRLDGINLPAGGNVISINAPGSPAPRPDAVLHQDLRAGRHHQRRTATSTSPRASTRSSTSPATSTSRATASSTTRSSPATSCSTASSPRQRRRHLPPRSITIATTQDFEGIVYAPNHDLDLALQAVAAAAAACPW